MYAFHLILTSWTSKALKPELPNNFFKGIFMLTPELANLDTGFENEQINQIHMEKKEVWKPTWDVLQ